jgi:hypothetical protein
MVHYQIANGRDGLQVCRIAVTMSNKQLPAAAAAALQLKRERVMWRGHIITLYCKISSLL